MQELVNYLKYCNKNNKWTIYICKSEFSDILINKLNENGLKTSIFVMNLIEQWID